MNNTMNELFPDKTESLRANGKPTVAWKVGSSVLGGGVRPLGSPENWNS